MKYTSKIHAHYSEAGTLVEFPANKKNKKKSLKVGDYILIPPKEELLKMGWAFQEFKGSQLAPKYTRVYQKDTHQVHLPKYGSWRFDTNQSTVIVDWCGKKVKVINIHPQQDKGGRYLNLQDDKDTGYMDWVWTDDLGFPSDTEN